MHRLGYLLVLLVLAACGGGGGSSDDDEVEIIPPSIIMIIFAYISRISIGKIFFGGAIPGFITACLYILYITIRCHLQPELAPKLQVTFFLGAGLVDAIPIIGVGIAMYLIFVVAG